MENNESIKPKAKSFKEIFSSRSFIKPLIAVSIGAIGGFLYYYFIGCASGTCAITGNPFMSTAMGGLLGFYAINSPCARGRC